MSRRASLYSAVAERLTRYEVDVDAGTLVQRETISLPAKVQYVWPHPVQDVIYVSTSDGGPRVASRVNHVSAFRLGADGVLSAIGEAAELPQRAVHLCVDARGRFVINAHNLARGSVTVHALHHDGSIGASVPQHLDHEAGIYPHQVRVFPSGRTVLLVDRGIDAQGERPEAPGALRTFDLDEGTLASLQVVAPDGGIGFGPRHVAFHPAQRILYACDERTNQLHAFGFDGQDVIEPMPRWRLPMLANPRRQLPRQLGGPIHVHPAGHTLYVVNRSDWVVERDGRRLYGGGENNIAVYSLDPATGEPRLRCHVETQSFHVRTFACDPSGRLLVAGSVRSLTMYSGDGRGDVEVPAMLTIFRIDAGGNLSYLRTVDVATAPGELHYWMGLI